MARHVRVSLLLAHWEDLTPMQRKERMVLTVLVLGAMLLSLIHPEAGFALSLVANLRWIWT